MNAESWIISGAVLIGLGIVFFTISQIALGSWIRKFNKE